jgi:peptidyl-prolyl cis-trans isomerase A (cyclophilin A)
MATPLMAGINQVTPSHAPEMYRTMVETTAGHFEIAVHRNWSPGGADRFFDLAKQGYYDDSRFYRVVAGKWAQFGIAGEPAVAQAWRAKTISDDRLIQSNKTGFVAFANIGPGTRSTQVFINLGDNAAQNDPEPGFAPFGKVIAGMDVVEKLYSGYGETSGGGMRAGHQDVLFAGGNRYLDTHFPRLDRLIRLAVVGS